MYLPPAASAVVSSNDTSSRNPSESTAASETIGPNKVPDAARLGRLHLPDGIERVLELDDDANCGKHQGADAEHRCQDPFHGFAGPKQHRVDRLCSRIAEQGP